MKGKPMFRYLFWLMLGALCFMISQPLIRIPLLDRVQSNLDVSMFIVIYPLAAGVLIGFSAGLAEESARFLFKLFLMKPAKTSILQPLIFGLGHGLAEAVFIMGPAILAGYSFMDLSWGLVERVIAISMHVSFSVVVWNGFQRHKRGLYLILAILLHGAVDGAIPFFHYYRLSIPTIEGIFAAFAIALGVYAIYSRRYYSRGGYTIEEEN